MNKFQRIRTVNSVNFCIPNYNQVNQLKLKKRLPTKLIVLVSHTSKMCLKYYFEGSLHKSCGMSHTAGELKKPKHHSKSMDELFGPPLWCKLTLSAIMFVLVLSSLSHLHTRDQMLFCCLNDHSCQRGTEMY